MGLFGDVASVIKQNSPMGDMARDTGLAPFIPGMGAYMGQQETNATNLQIAGQANAANIASAREQMAFQKEMSSTAHQREVEDLRKAGLNPILSGTGGSGASTPAGASGNSVAAKMENPAAGVAGELMNFASSLVGMRKTAADTKLVEAQTAKTGVDTKVAEKGIPQSDFVNRVYKLGEPYLRKVEQLLQPNAKKAGDYVDTPEAKAQRLKAGEDKFMRKFTPKHLWRP